EEDGEQHASVEADVGRRSGQAGTRQEIAKRRHQDESVDERVHSVERPSGPRCPESADLVGGQRLGGDMRHLNTVAGSALAGKGPSASRNRIRRRRQSLAGRKGAGPAPKGAKPRLGGRRGDSLTTSSHSAKMSWRK